MANNRKIETLGVSHLSTFIDKHELLQSYFDRNDKTPVWDGEIHVLKSPSEKKEEILGKVNNLLKISMPGKAESLNVSIAAGIVMHYISTNLK